MSGLPSNEARHDRNSTNSHGRKQSTLELGVRRASDFLWNPQTIASNALPCPNQDDNNKLVMSFEEAQGSLPPGVTLSESDPGNRYEPTTGTVWVGGVEMTLAQFISHVHAQRHPSLPPTGSPKGMLEQAISSSPEAGFQTWDNRGVDSLKADILWTHLNLPRERSQGILGASTSSRSALNSDSAATGSQSQA
ncbi:hypothetical protein M231_07449 [Tremella mesenterica]|uniref:Uncharacterized protein n=1 Tax=Tremella mesenterica TaxID=5217 RepID=A0A4Q1B934_TREME|nr:uncharacterized protein TREMEDRAFT_62394 [Tremella mesenterica DSM 1558]EIW69534.1 hypothetical protein TREMEDRAFT_62394 [Tremella mesenterica DSM 1558]RXK35278.1 hypothetical protein M231_07449 [Tremella mesenterica]